MASFRNELVNAASKGNTTDVKELLRAGEDVNQTGSGLTTALMAAAENGHLYTVAYLLQEAEADLGKKDRDGKTALDRAEKSYGTLQKLRIKKVKNAELELQLEEVIKYLKDMKKNPKHKIALKFENVGRTNNERRRNERMRELMLKTNAPTEKLNQRELDEKLVKACLDASLNARDDEWLTEDLPGIIKLLDEGADINSKSAGDGNTKGKFTPLWAVTLSTEMDINPGLVKFLIERGANVNVHYEYNGNQTALMGISARMLGYFKNEDERMRNIKIVVDSFCKAGVRPNAVDDDGNTLLHGILSVTSYTDIPRNDKSYEYIIKELCKIGADPNIKNTDDITPMDMAIEQDRTDFIELLEKCKKQHGGRKTIKRKIKNRVTRRR